MKDARIPSEFLEKLNQNHPAAFCPSDSMHLKGLGPVPHPLSNPDDPDPAL